MAKYVAWEWTWDFFIKFPISIQPFFVISYDALALHLSLIGYQKIGVIYYAKESNEKRSDSVYET